MMEERFTEDDLGKIVSLTVDIRNNDDDCYQRDDEGHLRVAYDAIVRYEFQLKISSKSDLEKIKVVDKAKRIIDPLQIARRLGAASIETLGEIVGLADDYVTLKSVKRRRN